MVGKKLDSQEVVAAISRMKRFPIIVYCSFISNFPGENAEDVKRTTKMIASLIAANPNFRNSPVYQYVPIPGTEIAAKAEESGCRRPESYEEWGDISFEQGCGIDSAGLGRKFFRALYFVTLFCDGKYKEYIDSPVIKFLSSLYRPIALLRLRRVLFNPIPEMRLFFALKKWAEKRAGA